MINNIVTEDCLIAIAHKTGLVLVSNTLEQNDRLDLSSMFISAIMTFGSEISGEFPKEVHMICESKKISIVARDDYRIIGIYSNPGKFGTIHELEQLLDLFVNYFEPMLTKVFGSDQRVDTTPFDPFSKALAKVIPKHFKKASPEDRDRVKIVEQIYRTYIY